MEEIRHLTSEELEAGLEHIRSSPAAEGVVEMIVRRPSVGDREVLDEGRLDVEQGLVGDNWSARGTPDRDMQLTLMNSRTAALVAQSRERWPLAGDQFFLDLDLSEENLPAGTRLLLGSALVEVTPPPHTGCKKFVERFGLDAMVFVNSGVGKQLHLRGVNARVVEPGAIRVGDTVARE